MIWNLLGVFIIGLCAGALGYALRKFSKGRLPKWVIPVCAGSGMFAYLAYYDYTWYEFKRGQLPQGSLVLQEHRESDFFRPWSYLVPSVNKFDVVDGQYLAREQDGEKIVQYIVYRFIKDPTERAQQLTQVLNCHTRERVEQDGAKPQAAPRVLQQPVQEALYRLVCTER